MTVSVRPAPNLPFDLRYPQHPEFSPLPHGGPALPAWFCGSTSCQVPPLSSPPAQPAGLSSGLLWLGQGGWRGEAGPASQVCPSSRQEGSLVSTNSCCHRTRGTRGTHPRLCWTLGAAGEEGQPGESRDPEPPRGSVRALLIRGSSQNAAPITTHASLSLSYELRYGSLKSSTR